MKIEHSRVRQTLAVEGDLAITVTDWSNGEGVDVSVQDKTSTQTLSLEYEDLYALRTAIVAHIEKAP